MYWAIWIGLAFVLTTPRRPLVERALNKPIAVARLLDQLWLVVPAFRDQPTPAWLVAAALAAVGGIWLAAFLWLITRRARWVAGTVEEVGRG